MPALSGIYVYPIKSLDARPLTAVSVSPEGSLEGDRQYALVDPDGEYINGKRTAAVHRVDASYDDDGVWLTEGDRRARFRLPAETEQAADWLDPVFEPSVSVVDEQPLGYPDDTTDFGPTVISTGTLETVASWFDAVDGPEEMRRRLRPNLVVDAEPFWEDRLYGPPGETVRFSVGDAVFEGTSPCQRCVVPSRDPDTGEAIPGFGDQFAQRREATLPEWAAGEQFDHYYRLMVNTRTTEAGRGETLAIDDPVSIVA
ncbi:MOSC domain-containing protein [Halapricum sp. CBA1109]|nr:MOSC domain-containing protein [Halapricum sp. CBA1109]